jgi:hypothetical protein
MKDGIRSLGNQHASPKPLDDTQQKHRRPEDPPVPLKYLTQEEQSLIKKRYPELFLARCRSEI